jgi:eukaryotic-like serine/threonine-protein kinase
MIGRRIGAYEFESKLGRGGVGTVYRARDHNRRDFVAVKVMHKHLTTQERAQSRFKREAEVLARLEHPNIVGVLDFLEVEQDFYMVLEFVRGETLSSGLQRLGAFSWERCVPWFCEALNALEYAHGEGIIHRDLKPSNLIVDMSGHVKILDFGMAKMADAAKQLTAPGMTLGTIAYMSKEQLLGKELDARSDFYSLGVCLYEVATGRLPFWSEVDRELALQIARREPTRPSVLRKGLSAAADEIILKALSKDREDRYADAASFRAALEASCGAKR